MGISVYWDNAEKTILRQVYSPTFDWDEYQAAFAQVHRLAGEVEHPISIIAEVGGIQRIPPNAIMYGSRALRDLPANVWLCVVVTPSRLTLTLLQAIQNVTHFDKIRIAASVEDSRRLIEEGSTIPGTKRS